MSILLTDSAKIENYDLAPGPELSPLTRAREWGPELRARREGQNLPPCQLSSYES